MEERWAKNDRYPVYKISNSGSIQNINSERRGPDRIYDPKRNILTSNLINNMGEIEKVSLPRLMAETFRGGPHDDCEVVQLDGDIYNLNIDNIAWDKNSTSADALYRPMYSIRNKETGKIYNSIYECAEDLGDTIKSVKRCVKNPNFITRTRNHLEKIQNEGMKRNV